MLRPSASHLLPRLSCEGASFEDWSASGIACQRLCHGGLEAGECAGTTGYPREGPLKCLRSK